MEHYYWTDWYSGWGWFLWFGLFFVIFSSFGNWGYTYRVHRRFDDYPQKSAINILNERYARGEIKHDEYMKMKFQLSDREVSPSATSRDARANANTNKGTTSLF